MAEGHEGELLLGIFLMEAWDSAGALEDGLSLLSPGVIPSAEALAPLVVSAHRLKGSAALHGFLGVSDLAEAAERLLEQSPGASPEGRVRGTVFLSEMVSLLKEVFDGISAVGVEDGARISEFRSRYPAFFVAAPRSASDDAPATLAMPAPRLTSVAVEMARFFSEGGEVLEYFLPEASEHLEATTTALLAFEAGAHDPETLGTVFRAVHTLKGAAYTVGCGPVGDASHQIEDLLVAVREDRLVATPEVTEAIFAGTAAIKRVLLSGAAVTDETALALERATRDLRGLLAKQSLPEGEAPVREGETPPPVLVATARSAAATAEPVSPVPPGFVRPEFLARLEALPRPAPSVSSTPSGQSIRVAVERLDALLNLAGELVIARSRLERRLIQLDQVSDLLLTSRTRLGQAGRDFEFRRHSPEISSRHPVDGRESDDIGGLRDLSELFAELEFDRYDDVNILARSVAEMSADVGEVQSQHASLLRSLKEDTAQIQRLTASLRKEVTRARMVPIGRLFARVAHQVREAARATGKTVTLTTRGESVEVDNGIIEQIADPLLHLIQNAIGHGIESVTEREHIGKPAQGQVTLSASQEGGFVLVQVEDDGSGIDTALLRQRAVERRLLPPAEGAALSEREALNLIFVPGFSTASAVTRTSGRGVGLDVVRTNVSRLNGEIHVETEPGRMTRFVLKLPLTMAIADALMVRCGPEVLALPLTAVSRMRSVACSEIVVADGLESVRVDGQSIELIRLARTLGVAEASPNARLPMVILRGGGRPFGVIVDELLGKEEIVIKSLGSFLDGVGPFSGATISGEGRVILLIDPTSLREASMATSAPGAGPEPPDGAGAAGPRRRVMLVDDSVSVRKFVGQMLEKAGFDVFTAVDGHDALEQLVELAVDVVVTDLEMPRVNGYALIEDLRRRAGTRDLPVIVLTTRAGAKHVHLARRLGVRHYVAKPVDEQSFVRAVEAVTRSAAEDATLAGSGRPAGALTE
jgi:chemosensory pili system protein ChpA (sensor histidine kinase/response regulator)